MTVPTKSAIENDRGGELPPHTKPSLHATPPPGGTELTDFLGSRRESEFHYLLNEAICSSMKRAAKWGGGGRHPVSRTNFNKIHASRFESVIVGETSGKRNFHDQTQIIHESRIPHEINHASHAFRYSRITFIFK